MVVGTRAGLRAKLPFCSAAALAPKCGPIGLPPKKVGEDIQKATSKWRGVKIEIEIADKLPPKLLLASR